jgi:hypothetical protein
MRAAATNRAHTPQRHHFLPLSLSVSLSHPFLTSKTSIFVRGRVGLWEAPFHFSEKKKKIERSLISVRRIFSKISEIVALYSRALTVQNLCLCSRSKKSVPSTSPI